MMVRRIKYDGLNMKPAKLKMDIYVLHNNRGTNFFSDEKFEGMEVVCNLMAGQYVQIDPEPISGYYVCNMDTNGELTVALLNREEIEFFLDEKDVMVLYLTLGIPVNEDDVGKMVDYYRAAGQKAQNSDN